MHLSALITASIAILAAAAPTDPLSPRAAKAYACDVRQLSQPTAPTPLPSPSGTLMMVALGKGTQNYSCADASPTTTPTPIGAMATLYNASCLAVVSQEYIDIVTEWADMVTPCNLAGLKVAGHHFFENTTTPTFNLTNINTGITETKVTNKSDAPNSTADVPWVFLKKTAALSGDTLQSVYRVATQGGVAPKNCAEKGAGVFLVPYSAQYWFYGSQ